MLTILAQSSLVLRFVNNDFQENKEPTIGGTCCTLSNGVHPRHGLFYKPACRQHWLTSTAAFLTQKISLPNRIIKFEIWDTAGQERFASLAPMYYRNAQAALVVYDLTKPTSLIKAKHWVAELQRQASPGIVIALVGNKLDLCAESGAEGPSDTEATAEGEGHEGAGAGAGPADADVEPTESGDARKVSTREAKSYAEEESLLFFETSAKTGANVADVFTAIANAIPETSLRGVRGAGGGTQTALSGTGNRAEEARVNLTERARNQKDNCAC